MNTPPPDLKLMLLKNNLENLRRLKRTEQVLWVAAILCLLAAAGLFLRFAGTSWQ